MGVSGYRGPTEDLLMNNECPACRTHCASRRSLRDDLKFDEVIEFFFPNVDKYEEEEVAFFEKERAHNKQIQDSIAQIYERQSEALHKRRPTAKETATTSTVRLLHSQRKAYSRQRRNSRGSEIQESEEKEDENDQDGNRDSSLSDERGPEVQPRRYKRRKGVRHSRPSSAANTSGGCFENEREQSTEISTSPGSGILWKAEGLTWGRGGARSHIRQGGASGSKDTRTRFCKQLVDHLHGLKEDDAEYVARQTSLKAENVELLLVKEPIDLNEEPRTINTSAPIDDLNSLSRAVDGSKLVLECLEGQETLAGLKNNFSPSSDNTVTSCIPAIKIDYRMDVVANFDWCTGNRDDVCAPYLEGNWDEVVPRCCRGLETLNSIAVVEG
ncbi:hypothetical protein LguiA_035147 [Lonicera macranthoides]